MSNFSDCRYVYLIANEDTGYHKIGFTNNLNERLLKLQTGSASKLKYVHTIKTVNFKALETALHKRFETCRLLGEWFDLSDEDVDYIKSISDKNAPFISPVSHSIPKIDWAKLANKDKK